MATVSNPATLSSVKTVFGGGLTLFGYRRGAGIPDIAAYSAVSTTQPRLASFAGLSYPAVSLIGQSITDTGTGGTNASGYLDLDPSGYYIRGSGVPSSVKSNTAWLLTGTAANYDVQLQKVSGVSPTGSAVNTWINCATGGNWIWTQTPYGTKDFSGYMKLRSAGGGSELANASVSVSVVSEP